MSKITRIADWVLKLPLVWGGLACLGFYALVLSGVISSPLVVRYTTRDPVEYVTMALFFVGAAALLMRLSGVLGQMSVLSRRLLDPPPAGGQPVEDAASLLAQLDEAPARFQQSYLVRRLRDVIEFVRRKDSADDLDSHLRRLEEQDADRMMAGYALTRIVIWAVPILGFLGTVIGITLAIMNLNPEALEKSLTTVTAGLGIAFDTTALALSLSIVLMLLKFFVERTEEGLLASVNQQAFDELTGRFQQLGTGSDPQVASIGRMCDHVVRAVETMAARQAEVWRTTVDEQRVQWESAAQQSRRALAETVEAAGQHWQSAAVHTGQMLTESIAAGLAQSLGAHAASLAAGAESHGAQLTAALDRQMVGLTDRVASLAKTAETHTAALSDGAVRHAAQLESGAQQLVGRLSQGLEKMAELLVEALQRHGELLTQAEQDLASENRKHLSEVEAALGEAMVVSADRQEKLIQQSESLLKEMQVALVETAGAAMEHQEQLVKQGEVLLRVVDSTGQVQKLEDSLNRNLNALGRAHNFEETLLSLSAAIQLLSARVGRGVAEPGSRREAA